MTSLLTRLCLQSDSCVGPCYLIMFCTLCERGSNSKETQVRTNDKGKIYKDLFSSWMHIKKKKKSKVKKKIEKKEGLITLYSDIERRCKKQQVNPLLSLFLFLKMKKKKYKG